MAKIRGAAPQRQMNARIPQTNQLWNWKRQSEQRRKVVGLWFKPRGVSRSGGGHRTALRSVLSLNELELRMVCDGGQSEGLDTDPQV